MKTITFLPGVHLVTLEGNTTSEDFLSAFQYENRYVEHINPTLSPVRELDFSKDCCPVFLLLTRREDVERFIDRLNRLSTQHSATIFVFISDPWEYLYEVRMSFTTILTYDKYINGGIVEKGVGDVHEGPYNLDLPHSPIEDAPRRDPAEEPSTEPWETMIKIPDLRKSRGFHQTSVSVFNADALIRGDKTDFLCSASHNVQKGDWLVLSTDNTLFHAINHIVWEVSFVSYIPHSETNVGFGQVALSLRCLLNTRFEKGMGGRDDCIVTTNP